MGKNSKQRRQATVEELSWAREYMDLFGPCSKGYTVTISKKGNMLIRKASGGDIVSIPKASIASRQAFDKYLGKCQRETMYSMAAGIEKKYWKFLKDMVVEKKERKKKKETETKGTKIEQKTEKTETKTETKTEPAA